MGKFTIKQILSFTSESSQFNNRFFFRLRDCVKSVQIRTLKRYNPFNPTEKPFIYFSIISSSYPQYYPYINVKGKKSKTQRKIKHSYDITLEFYDELSINTTEWKVFVGKNLPIIKPSQDQIKTIRKGTLNKWKKQAERKFKIKKDQNDWVQKMKKNHKKTAPYLNEGDFHASRGINLDWVYRANWVYYQLGHSLHEPLVNRPPDIVNPQKIPFTPKHFLNIVEALLKMGKLST